MLKPNSTSRANWSVARSRAFLRAVINGYESEPSDGSDEDSEMSTKARMARVKVIHAVGGDIAAVFAATNKL